MRKKNISRVRERNTLFYFFTLFAEVGGPKWFRCTGQENPQKIAVRISPLHCTSQLCNLIQHTEDFEYVCHCRQWQVRIPRRSDTDFMLSILCRVPMITSRDRSVCGFWILQSNLCIAGGRVPFVLGVLYIAVLQWGSHCGNTRESSHSHHAQPEHGHLQ